MISALLDHLWQSTLLALGVSILALLFRKASADVRYGLWLTASVKFLIPFAALAALGRRLAPEIRIPVDVAPGAVLIEKAAQPFSQIAPAVQSPAVGAPLHQAPIYDAPLVPAHAAPHLDPALIAMAVLAVWALGGLVLLVRWMVRWARVSAVARAARPLNWPAPMPIKASASLMEPGLVGLWRPVLLVPETLKDHLGQTAFAAIVEHEACHLRRRDNLTAALHMLVEALFWPHPLVWWIGAKLIAEREQACDEAVVKAGHDRAAYARGLVESCRLYLQSPLPCVAGAAGADLKTRVQQIMTAPAALPLSAPKKALLAAAGLCAVATPVAAGLLTTPAGQGAMARASAVASRLAPMFAPAQPVPEQAPVRLARNETLLSPLLSVVARLDARPAILARDIAPPRVDLAPVAVAPAPAVPAPEPVDPKAEAARFVASYAALTAKDAAARWASPICVRVVGLEPEQAAAVKARVEEVAKGVGITVRASAGRQVITGTRVRPDPGGACPDNIQIGFTKDPQAMLAGVMKRSGPALGDASSNTRSVKTVTLPIQAWYLTNGVQAARYDVPDETKGWAGLKVPAVWQVTTNPSMNDSAGYVAPGSVNGNSGGPGPGAFDGGFPSSPYYPPSNHRAFRNVFVIVDDGRTGDRSLGLIADYVAMLALSQPRLLGTCQTLPSITDLFAEGCGRPVPDGLTPADAAYLTALYDAKLSRTADVADGMARILSQVPASAFASGQSPGLKTPASTAPGRGPASSPRATPVARVEPPPADRKEQAARFVSSYAAATRGRQLIARWADGICVRVVGLTGEQAAAVRARVDRLARSVGAPVQGLGCTRDNVQIGFTTDAQRMLDDTARRRGGFLGDGTSGTKGVRTVTLPIQAWYLTNGEEFASNQGLGAGGLGDARSGVSALKVPVVWQQQGIEGGYLGSPYDGGAYIPPGGPGTPGNPPTTGDNPFGTGGAPDARARYFGPRAFLNVFVIIDLKRAGDRKLEALADYAAMLVLSQPRALGTCQPLPSITDLYAGDCGRPAPEALTAADTAYLTALYANRTTPPSSQTVVAARMAELLGGVRLASR